MDTNFDSASDHDKGIVRETSLDEAGATVTTVRADPAQRRAILRRAAYHRADYELSCVSVPADDVRAIAKTFFRAFASRASARLRHSNAAAQIRLDAWPLGELDRLPTEILIDVLEYLDLRSLLAFSHACGTARNLAVATHRRTLPLIVKHAMQTLCVFYRTGAARRCTPQHFVDLLFARGGKEMQCPCTSHAREGDLKALQNFVTLGDLRRACYRGATRQILLDDFHNKESPSQRTRFVPGYYGTNFSERREPPQDLLSVFGDEVFDVKAYRAKLDAEFDAQREAGDYDDDDDSRESGSRVPTALRATHMPLLRLEPSSVAGNAPLVVAERGLCCRACDAIAYRAIAAEYENRPLGLLCAEHMARVGAGGIYTERAFLHHYAACEHAQNLFVDAKIKVRNPALWSFYIPEPDFVRQGGMFDEAKVHGEQWTRRSRVKETPEKAIKWRKVETGRRDPRRR